VNIPGLLAFQGFELWRPQIIASLRSRCAATIHNSEKMPNATSPQSFFRSYHCKPTNKAVHTNSSNPETRQTVRKYSYNNLPGVTGGPPPSGSNNTRPWGHTSWQYGAPPPGDREGQKPIFTCRSHRHRLGGRRHSLSPASDTARSIDPFLTCPRHMVAGNTPGRPCSHSSLGGPSGGSSPCREGSLEYPYTEGSPDSPCRSTWEVETCGSHSRRRPRCRNTHHDHHHSHGGISHGLYAHTGDQDSFRELVSLGDHGVTFQL